jgi:hypothetical protein
MGLEGRYITTMARGSMATASGAAELPPKSLQVHTRRRLPHAMLSACARW